MPGRIRIWLLVFMALILVILALVAGPLAL